MTPDNTHIIWRPRYVANNTDIASAMYLNNPYDRNEAMPDEMKRETYISNCEAWLEART